jgi:hypothetical protein
MTTPSRIRKILALLDSDQAGEAQAAANALRRLLGPGSIEPRADRCELEASLAYATEAIAALTDEIKTLRQDNTALRLRAAAMRGPSRRLAA